MYRAFYSESQAKVFGFAVFEAEDGSLVRVSETTDEEKPSGLWKDYIFVGMVKRLIGNFEPNGRLRPPLTLREFEEVGDEDIIDIRPSCIIDAKYSNSKQQWNSISKLVNTNLLVKKSGQNKNIIQN